MPEINGQAITRADANDLFVRYFDLKDRNRTAISELLASDAEAQRYYCGTTDEYAAQMDLLFVLDKDCLQRIMNKINEGEADGVMAFPGAHTGGKPTIMLFPVKYDGSGSERQYVVLDDGEQHPGIGGNGASAIFTSPELPTTLTESQLY